MHERTANALAELKEIGVNCWKAVDTAVQAAGAAMGNVNLQGIPEEELPLIDAQKERLMAHAAAMLKIPREHLGD